MAAKPKRAYVTDRRVEAAAATHDAILAAATTLLNGRQPITMEAVAAASGVTRLTVYNQFGSRRGLLEAVFDEHARLGGIKALADAAQAEEPLAGLDQMIDTLCNFWGQHPVIAALQDAAVGDPELRVALDSRQSRRREVIDALLEKMPGKTGARGECGDLLFALVSLSMFRSLSDGRSSKQVAALLKRLCRATLDAEGLGVDHGPRRRPAKA